MSEFRLLVIEDDKRVADLVCVAADEVGFITKWAVGPSAIMTTYQSFKPDVIVLDVLMPEMDGLEVLQFLREEFSQAKIVILSGSEDNSRRITESMGQALGFQVVGNIPKPFRLVLLKQVLEDVRRNIESERIDAHQRQAGGQV